LLPSARKWHFELLVGDDDRLGLAANGGKVAARLIPVAVLHRLPGVGHYDFVAAFTNATRAILPFYLTRVSQVDTHRRTLQAAETFFSRQLGVSP
jgi:hypothetical protein